MNIPPCPEVDGYDRAAAQTVLARAIATGGGGLVVGALRGLPGVLFIEANTGFFRGAPASVEIGTWRYHEDKRGRLVVSHVVSDIVLAEETPGTAEAAQHIASVIATHLASVGEFALPDVTAMLEGLSVATG